MRVFTLLSMACSVTLTSYAVAIPQNAPGDEGSLAYEEGDYHAAADVYDVLLEKSAEDPRLHFNLGATRYKQSEWEQALREFEQAVTAEETSEQAEAYYNLGNALFRLGRPEESLRSYKLAMETDPDDEDTKFNYEFVKQMLAEATQPEPDDNEEEQESQDQSEEEDRPEQGREDEQQPSPQEESEQPEKGERQGEKPPGDLSREEAEQILDALRRSETELMKERMRLHTRGAKLEKDW